MTDNCYTCDKSYSFSIDTAKLEKRLLTEILTENGFQVQVDEALRLYEDGLTFREIFSALQAPQVLP